MVNLRTNLLKWTGPSDGPVPWKFVEKLFFNKGLNNKRSDFLGAGRQAIFFQKKMFLFLHKHFFGRKNLFPKISCHNSEPSKHCWGPEYFVWHNSEPSYTNQDATLLLHVPDQILQCHQFLSLPTWRLFSTHLFQTGNTCLNCCLTAAISTHQAAAQNSGAHWIQKIEIPSGNLT